MNLYQRFAREIREAEFPDGMRWYDLIDNGSPHRLINLATSETLEDPQRDMARKIIEEMYRGVFEPETGGNGK